MPIAKVLKRDRAMIRVMLHAQQNDERSAGRAGIEDLPATDGLTFRSGLFKEGQDNVMAAATRRERRSIPPARSLWSSS